MSFIQNFFSRHMPNVKASDDEEELQDPQTILREKCTLKPKCAEFKEKLETCNQRVNSRKKTEESCLEEAIDFISCVDHCAAEKLFDHLK